MSVRGRTWLMRLSRCVKRASNVEGKEVRMNERRKRRTVRERLAARPGMGRRVILQLALDDEGGISYEVHRYGGVKPFEASCLIYRVVERYESELLDECVDELNATGGVCERTDRREAA